MMFSRHYGGTGTFRTASEFDFFRGLFFEKTCPAIFDDGTIGNETIKKQKAFSDVGDQETITKERWNGRFRSNLKTLLHLGGFQN